MNIQLLSYPTSPYAMKVGCYLKYKQLAFKFIATNPLSPREIRFTRQRQVPVLVINNEWKTESSDIGIWIDTLCPERPLLGNNKDQRAEILNVDKWISDKLIPGRFRNAIEWSSTKNGLYNGWHLARLVHSASPLPIIARMIWPFALKRAPFIVAMMEQIDLQESLEAMHERLAIEFIEHLQGGPFLAGQQQCSLADLSAYPLLLSQKLLGMKGRSVYLEHSEIYNWAKKVAKLLPENPLLVDDRYIKKMIF
ncbi:MAG: glutathione S-transferase [Oceanicoccus sp.]|jgi:glutathione S-transferase